MSKWRPINTVPTDGTVVLLADFEAACLLSGAPHVWAARWGGDMWLECSYAAINENGTPTHWAPMPEGGPAVEVMGAEAVESMEIELTDAFHAPVRAAMAKRKSRH